MAIRRDVSENECGAYFFRYINQVEVDKELLLALEEGKEQTLSFFRELTPDQWEHRYEEGKWSPKEIFLHLMDTERVFTYRALRFARSENADLPGFDQDEFAENARGDQRDPKDLLEEYKAVRNATLQLFKSFDESTLARTGKASGNNMSVRAAGFVLCGHDRHHIQVIKERYL